MSAPSPIGHAGGLKAVLSAADDLAGTPTTVLLLGESGTGKEVIARYIHQKSPRARQAYVAVNCAALPGDLLESELFGHERGAFTGATDRKIGRIEQASGGTLVLDEISELPLLLQAKLLRVLQEREVDRLGGSRPVPVDLRVVATSNRDLKAMVDKGLFRADLFYRLNVFPLRLPALRERRGDIPALAAHLAERVSQQLGRPTPTLTSDALAALSMCPFPGNVRELGNLIERAIVRCRGEQLCASDFGLGTVPFDPEAESEMSTERLPAWLPLDLEELERIAIGEALRRAGGNRTHAARLLGIGLRTLRTRLNERGERQPITAESARISQLLDVV